MAWHGRVWVGQKIYDLMLNCMLRFFFTAHKLASDVDNSARRLISSLFYGLISSVIMSHVSPL